ncbi:hypothetical protein BHE74_00043194 [Ensete ventricosum]|nr:hypothetical protein BHE74_00043194 [Ensete ventricosum]
MSHKRSTLNNLREDAPNCPASPRSRRTVPFSPPRGREPTDVYFRVLLAPVQRPRAYPTDPNDDVLWPLPEHPPALAENTMGRQTPTTSTSIHSCPIRTPFSPTRQTRYGHNYD